MTDLKEDPHPDDYRRAADTLRSKRHLSAMDVSVILAVADAIRAERDACAAAAAEFVSQGDWDKETAECIADAIRVRADTFEPLIEDYE